MSTLIQKNQYNTDKQNFEKKADYDTKITDTKGKYFITPEYNKFMNDMFDAKIKQKTGQRIYFQSQNRF